MDLSVRTNNSQETQDLAYKLAQKLEPGDVVALSGDLGGGKTTFTKGLLAGLQGQGVVTSPTFVLQKKYAVDKGNINELLHFDVYRINTTEELFALGWEEILDQGGSVIVVEWAEKIKSALPPSTYWVKFEYIDENTRHISIQKLF